MTAASAPAADPEWYRHFGLDRDPFAEGGMHGLFYPGGARQETVEQLLHLARYSDCVLLVTGVAGAGKSTTRRHFVAQAAADTRCCVVEAALLDGPEQWLRRVLAGFGLRSSGSPDLAADLRQLAAFCAGRSDSGNRSWLVIDDAQDLHADVAAILARVLEATGRGLRLAFFAEPRWREVLQAALPGGAALHTLELQPLDAGETHAYLHYRLNTAGLDGEPPFNAQEFERIQRESGGIPGRINAAARAVLQTAASEVEQPLNALPLWHFGVIAATLLALLLLYVWGSLDQDAPRPDPQPVARAPATGPDTVPAIQIAPAEPGPADDPARAQDAAESEPAVPLPAIALAPAAETDEELMDAPLSEPGTAAAPAAGELQRSGAPALAGAQIEAPQAVGQGEPAPREVAPSAVPSGAARAVSAQTRTGAAQSPATQLPAAGSPDAAEYVYRAEGRAGGVPSADEEYLLGLDPGHFVLQIMASDDGARVRAFAARNGQSLRVYRKLNNGREWYALVQGEYPSRAAAEAALGGLSPRLRDSRPWVRRLDSVQKEIRAARAM